MFRKSLIIAVLVLSIFASVSCASSTVEDSVTVNVNGSGTVYLKADMVTFQLQVDESGETTGIAQQLANKKTSQIFSLLRSFKISDEDITTTSLNFSTDYEWDSTLQRSVRTGERVTQTVSVKMHDIDNFGKLVDELGTKLTGIRLSNVRFDAEDHSEALIKARELAYQDAFAKAATYAKAAGYMSVSPVCISDSYASVSSTRATNDGMLYKAMGVSAEAAYATETPTGNLCVTVETVIEFKVK